MGIDLDEIRDFINNTIPGPENDNKIIDKFYQVQIKFFEKPIS